MQITRNNFVISSNQSSYSAKQTQESMSNNHSSHSVSKTRNIDNKEKMQSNCNMKGMNEQINATRSLNNKISDSNLGSKIDVHA